MSGFGTLVWSGRSGGVPVLALTLACNSLEPQADSFPSAPGEIPSSAEGSALCGGQGEPCCTPPLPACALDLACDGATARCVTAAPAPGCDPAESECAPAQGRSRLCRTEGDCASGETCCPAGALGMCVALEPAAACPGSDLAIALWGSGAYLTTEVVDAGACSVGCFESSGARRVLGVSLRLFNVGDVDAVLGTPDAPGTFLGCGPHVENALIYELRAEDGTILRQLDARLKPGCVDEAAPESARARFSCEMLGLERGYYDDRAAGCTGLDISGVPEGRYTLAVRLELDPGVFPDTDLSNNRLELAVTLQNDSDPDPTVPCPDPGEILLTDEAQDCGWSASPVAECRPGEPFVVSCPECAGEMFLRLCPGEGPCNSAESIDDSSGIGGACPVAGGTCPDSGAFTALMGAVDAGESFRCDLELQYLERDPLRPCFETSASDALPDRDCGWTIGLTEDCVPGELVSVGCPDACVGAPVLLACDGDEPCLRASDQYLGMAEGHTEAGAPDSCPVVAFVCPAEGRYTILGTPNDPESSYTCALTRVDGLGPTDPCSAGIAAGYFNNQNCGWLRVGDEACTPGENIDVQCALCAGAPDLRVCDGSDACIPQSPRELGQDITGDSCPSVSFACPASGQYSAWAFAYEEVETDVCRLLSSPLSRRSR